MAQSIERGTDEPRAPRWLEPALNGIPSAKVGELVRLAIEKSRLAETVVDNLRGVFEHFGAPIIVETLLDLFERIVINDAAPRTERAAAAVGFAAVYASGREVPRVDLNLARIRIVEEIEQLDQPTRELVRDVREGTIEELALLRRGYAIVRCAGRVEHDALKLAGGIAEGSRRDTTPAPKEEWRVVKASQLAVTMGVSERTVLNRRKAGKFPSISHEAPWTFDLVVVRARAKQIGLWTPGDSVLSADTRRKLEEIDERDIEREEKNGRRRRDQIPFEGFSVRSPRSDGSRSEKSETYSEKSESSRIPAGSRGSHDGDT